MLADTLEQLRGLELRDEDGAVEILELLPPATDAEVSALEARLPAALPADIRAALSVSIGLVNGPLESFTLLGLNGFGLEEVFPSAHSIAGDGYGNFWVVDLHPDSRSWSPVWYACHDPPVIVYQASTVEQFLRGATTGQGFSWGRYGPITACKRHGTAPIWGIARPTTKSRISHFLFGRDYFKR